MQMVIKDTIYLHDNKCLLVFCLLIYVITVGALRPVYLGSCEMSRAICISGCNISLAIPKTFSFSYESMYNLM